MINEEVAMRVLSEPEMLAINGGITDQQAEKDGYAVGEAVGHALKAIAVVGGVIAVGILMFG